MKNSDSILQEIFNEKIVAIVREVLAEDIVKTAEALLAGGVRMMEITFDQRNSEGIENTLRSLDMVKEHLGDRILLGAGTVLSADQAEKAKGHGADYVISPNVDAAVIQKTKELGMISIPGALTPTEAAAAYNAGADIVKLFPAGVWGTEYIKAVHAPLAHIPFMAVGNVGIENIKAFFQAGVRCVGIGSNLVNRVQVKQGEFDSITEYARKLKEQL